MTSNAGKVKPTVSKAATGIGVSATYPDTPYRLSHPRETTRHALRPEGLYPFSLRFVLTAFLNVFMFAFLLILLISAMSPPSHALGGDKGQPEVNIFGGIADNGVLVAVGVVDPSPLSSQFIPLEEVRGTVRTNDLWFALYVPKTRGVPGEDLTFNVKYWKEREEYAVRTYKDGSTERVTRVVEYDVESDVIKVPVQNKLYLDMALLKNHKNLTHVKITYRNFDWEFVHQSTPAAQSVGWVNNLGDVWFLYIKATLITMIVALLAFGFGRHVFDKVKYVPPLSIAETAIALFFLLMFGSASYSWLEYNIMSYQWYVMQVPVFVIVSFLSLQFFRPDVRTILGIRIPPQREGPDIEMSTHRPLIVRSKTSDIENCDTLVDRWSWKNVLYRLISNGPAVNYDLHQKFHTRDLSGNYDDIYMLHPDNPPEFEYPYLAWKKFHIGFLPLWYPYIEKGMATLYLAPRYESDKIAVMSDIDVINDNNDAREEAESEVQILKVKVQSKATEKAASFLGVVTTELFGKEPEEPVPEEEIIFEEEDVTSDDEEDENGGKENE